MQALLRRRQWAFLRGHRARGRLLLLRRVVGTGVLARIIKIAPVRESSARSKAEREHAEQKEKFHAESNQIGPGLSTRVRKQLRGRLLRGKFRLRQGLWTED